MGELIERYEVRIVEAGCAPGSARYGIDIDIADDIDAVLPYLNAVLDNAWYDHEGQILIWRGKGQAYAYRPHQIKVARVEEPLRAREIAAEVVEQVNKIWREREQITPRLETRRPPAVFDIFKLLPKSNCKKCGYPTCLAFAAAFRAGEVELDQCLPLCVPEQSEAREKIEKLSATR